jgi:hypothetical protein
VLETARWSGGILVHFCELNLCREISSDLLWFLGDITGALVSWAIIS